MCTLWHGLKSNKVITRYYTVQYITILRITWHWQVSKPWRLLHYRKSVGKTHLQLKFRIISFVNDLLLSQQIVLKFCIEHGSITAMLCVKCQNDLTSEIDVMDKRDFVRFEFKMSFGRISYMYILQQPTDWIYKYICTSPSQSNLC